VKFRAWRMDIGDSSMFEHRRGLIWRIHVGSSMLEIGGDLHKTSDAWKLDISTFNGTFTVVECGVWSIGCIVPLIH
jgi:hypothetical protein